MSTSPLVEEEGIPWMAFMCALKHEHADYLENMLNEYDIGYYIMGLEKCSTHKHSNGEHFHFLVQMSLKQYNTFAKRAFIDKFKLHGRARDGVPRQYGKVKQIENLFKMAAYTVKDGNYRTNCPEEEMKTIVEKAKACSSQKEEKKNWRDALMGHITQAFANAGIEHHEKSRHREIAGMAIIEYYQEKEDPFPLSRAAMDGFIKHYYTYVIKLSPEQIWCMFYAT